MTALATTMTDSATMLRRSLRHLARYPSLILMMAGIPVVMLLLFVYVFGGALGDGIAGGGRSAYVQYVTPGIILMTIAMAGQGTAISVATDMTEGIITRFRTMAISRAAVLTGHVLGSMFQTMIAVAAVTVAALVVGFRPAAGPLGWIAATAVLVFTGLAITWLSVALGLVTDSVETASNLPMPLMLLPFLGSGFVPTDSMPPAMRWFAEHQPFTPINETVRGLLMGTPVGGYVVPALAWCAGITLLGYLWARFLYNRGRAA
jgi:ABC-2 type transport system permease protein